MEPGVTQVGKTLGRLILAQAHLPVVSQVHSLPLDILPAPLPTPWGPYNHLGLLPVIRHQSLLLFKDLQSSEDWAMWHNSTSNHFFLSEK